MRKLLTIAFVLCVAAGFAQRKPAYAASNAGYKTTSIKYKYFIEFNSGINNYTGILGAAFNAKLNEKVSLKAGAGFSSWGIKTFGGVNFFPMPKRHLYITGGVSYSLGKERTEYLWEFKDGTTKTIAVQRNPIIAVNLGIGSKYVLKSGNFLYWQVGYSAGLARGSNSYEFINSAIKKSDMVDPEIFDGVMDVYAPNGILMCFGYAFHL